MIAAGKAAEAGLRVLLCEKNPYTGKKLGITGKGRCNVTNNCSVPELIKNVKGGGRFLYSAFNKFGPDKVMAFFEEMGVALKTERGNRVFPVSDKAADIVLALRKFLRQNGVTVKTCCVTDVLTQDGAVSGVVTPKDSRKTPKTKFYCDEISHGSPNGFLFPVLGALRALVVEKDGKYQWTHNPFAILDKVGPDLVCTTVERSRTLGNDPVKVGKDTGNWQTLYMRVKFEAMSSK